MDEQRLPDDFREFLRLLNEAETEYLLIGGYAVGYYGYPRTTADIDFWIAMSPENADKLFRVFRDFGMADNALGPDLFLQPGRIIRMGLPPVRIEVLTEIDGVDFDECFAEKERTTIDGETVNLISRRHLLANKKASGRPKDLADYEFLLSQQEEE